MDPHADPNSDPTLAALRLNAGNGAPEALYRLASALVAREAVDEAFDVFADAAERGQVASQVEVARMQLFGVGTEVDACAAVAWLLRAEHAGSAVAGYWLALVSLGGIVLPRDFEAAARRLLVAAKDGQPAALRALAMHFGRDPDNGAAMRQSEAMLGEAASRGDVASATLLAERIRHGEIMGSTRHDLPRLRALAAQDGIVAFPSIPGTRAPRTVAAPGGLLQLDLESTLATPPVSVRSQAPRVGSIDGLLSAEECRYVVAMGAARLRRAWVVDPKTGERLVHQVRTSHDATLHPLLEDFQLRLLQLRMAAAIGMEFTHAEPMVLLRYQPGQEYRPHRDYLPPETLAADRPEAGQRAATLCCYLSEVEAGGGTAFPVAGLVVEPRIGRAVAFRNADDAGRPDPQSLHAGLPVERGEKWLATLWLRARRYRSF